MLFSFLIFFSVFCLISSIFCLLGGRVDALVLQLACSVSKEALVRLLLRNGCSSVTLIMAVGFALRAFFLATGGGLSMANYMMNGAAESSNSALFTYTSDLVEDSASSGRSRSTTSSVNQPLQGEQATPPALPVMQEAANRAPPYVPYPHQLNEIIGGDSVESIQRRLLGTNLNPSAHDIQMSRIQAEDLFEVKVDIIRKMAGLHPSGDWMGRGARALDNPRTATGEEDLTRLHKMNEDLQNGNLQSATFRLLVERVRLRAGEDQHSAT
jgi:hypothetical protein